MLALENMDEKLIKSMAEACNDVNRLNFYGEGAVSAPATTVEVTKEEIEKSISYTYADLGQEEIRKRTKKHKLNRVVGAP